VTGEWLGEDRGRAAGYAGEAWQPLASGLGRQRPTRVTGWFAFSGRISNRSLRASLDVWPQLGHPCRPIGLYENLMREPHIQLAMRRASKNGGWGWGPPKDAGAFGVKCMPMAAQFRTVSEIFFKILVGTG
jgi:hypothetical protein